MLGSSSGVLILLQIRHYKQNRDKRKAIVGLKTEYEMEYHFDWFLRKKPTRNRVTASFQATPWVASLDLMLPKS
ncbi:hypothetical protein PoB_005476100 [Plakobranchus ocellatus]|uniref:Uncharacterized protein n=1 Tax=Plakobranchus ocellatus TaxID=259542 RepID=A0AAV4BYP1_9GAST|nr:hypothetical protein PoB_005476100 [Plakobranchus ocellatus]